MVKDAELNAAGRQEEAGRSSGQEPGDSMVPGVRSR